MTYDLAKKLKDAGFPHDWCEGTGCPQHPYPSLSELIEACGKDFRKLEYVLHEEFKTGVPMWYAYEFNKFRNLNASGPTPEEAVANLWLALNA
jgi:hypothetical protein